jgi:DNA repair photolyase
MRWDGQTLTTEDPNALPGLQTMAGLVRSVQTPEFAGITFHEVRCRSALNRVPDTSRVPFRWTINPYRGCSHACVYCFARNTHTYLDLDAGADFDRQIVVKTNIAEVLRRELARPRWTREHVAMGTNTDPYQRAEGRYRLMPPVIAALAGSRTPFSILTKGTLLGRDLPLLGAAAKRVKVAVSISLALLDEDLHRTLEPGTPAPRARLDLIRRIRAAGLPCGVLVAPILPYLTDSDGQLEALVSQLATAGATSISGIALYLRPGTREWFLAWLRRTHPELVDRYAQLYAGGAYVPKAYSEDLQQRLRAVQASVRVTDARTART